MGRSFRWLLGTLVALLLVGGLSYYSTSIHESLFGDTVRVKHLRPPDVEVAWLHTSTNITNWERFVEGANAAAKLMPRLHVDTRHAFPDRTTETPEITLKVPEHPGKIRIRWYKLAGGIGYSQWVEALLNRDPPPLAIIGGGSSDRAVDLAEVLESQTRDLPPEERPLFLMTTATAVSYRSGSPTEEAPKLTGIYPGRTFRFCFNNQQMAQAIVDFLWQSPDYRPRGELMPELAAMTPVAAPSPWLALGSSIAQRVGFPPKVFLFDWDDDPFSQDLVNQFDQELNGDLTDILSAPRVRVTRLSAPFSVGRFHVANPSEAEHASTILRELSVDPGQRSLLILPSLAAPARRILRRLAGEAPLIGQHLVAVNGDGISFNVVYRDAEFAWNILAMPLPLVLFAHQNPVKWDESPPGSAAENPPPGPNAKRSSTDDVLLVANLVEQLVNAVAPAKESFAADPDQMAERLHANGYFDAEGDRKGGGEYLLCVKPIYVDGNRISSNHSIEVWHREGGVWKIVRTLFHDRPGG